MSQIQTIQLGTAPAGSDGDSNRTSSTKINLLLGPLVGASGKVVMEAGIPAVVTDPASLLVANNLSDIANDATARVNLGVPSGSGVSTGTNTGDQTLNGLLPSQSGQSGNFLTTNGSNASWAATSGGGGSIPAGTFDVVATYHGSGSAQTTTGNISSSSSTTTLTVGSAIDFAINQGICVIGAGAGGTNLVTTISNIVGTTITVASPALTTVAGAVVQHDDTLAINTALAAALTAGGGTVLLSNINGGRYRCSGALNGTTNSVLTIPQNSSDASGIYPHIILKGSIEGKSNTVTESGYGNVMLDFLTAPAASGTQPSGFAVHAFVDPPDGLDTNANPIRIEIDEIYWLFRGNSDLNGISLNNSLQARIGNNVVVTTQSVSGAIVQPTNQTWGIRMPGLGNNVYSFAGACQVIGFYHGIWTGELCVLGRPYVIFCVNALTLGGSLHPVIGSICTQDNNHDVNVLQNTPSAPVIAVNLIVESENFTSGWWSTATYNIVDPGNWLRGLIQYTTGSQNGTTTTNWTRNGAQLCQIVNSAIGQPITQTFKGDNATSSVTFQLPVGCTNLRIMFTGGTDSISAAQLQLQFNGDTASHYDWAIAYNINGTWSFTTDGSGATTVMAVGNLPATGATTPGDIVIDVPGYTGTVFWKAIQSRSGTATNGSINTTQQIALWRGSWHSAAAITSVTCLVNLGHFATGSLLTVITE